MSTSCGNPATEQDALMIKRTKFDKTKICVKCKERTGNIIIRHAVYCKECFFPLVSTRFRKVLGPTINAGGRTPKNANARGGRLRGLLKAPGSLVIGHSGGLGSTVLLDLVAKSYFYRSTTAAGDDSSALGTEHPRNKAKEDGGSADVWKGNPAVCYVEVSSIIPGARDRTEELRTAIQAYSDPSTKFEIDFIPLRLEDAFDGAWWERVGGKDLGQVAQDLGIDINNECLPVRHNVSRSTPLQSLHTYLSSLPTPTAVHSAISSLVRVLLLLTSASRNASHLLLGTSLTSLSMNTISGLAQGAGFALVSESIDEGWAPSNSQHVSIVRPLRDVGIKECAFWAWWSNLSIPGRDRYPTAVSPTPGSRAARTNVKQDLKSSSIDALTHDFIMGLEKDYPSTVSTIARTIAKVTTKETGIEGGCILCQKPAQPNVQAWKASISIRSYHDESFVNAKHPLPLHYTDLQTPTDMDATSSLSSSDLAHRLCYACHTTLTSRSSRASSSANPIDIPLPQWVKASIPLLEPGDSPDETTFVNDADRAQGNVAREEDEVWKRTKLSPGHIKDKIGAFLLDDGDESIIYDTLDERYAYVPPDEDMIERVRRLFVSENREEAAENLRILRVEPSDAVVKGLRLSQDDIDASKDVVLIAGYEPDKDHENEMGPLYCQEDDEVDVSNPQHAICIFDVVPKNSDEGQTGIYHKRNDPEEEYNLWTHWDSARLITFSAYSILKTVAPDLEPSSLYRVFTDKNIESERMLGYPKAVEYGPIAKIWDQEALWTHVPDAEDADAWWVRLLCCSKATEEEVLRNAWDGGGNLWVYVRPDRFPIAKAVAAPSLSRFRLECDHLPLPQDHLGQLPLEVLLLICHRLPVKALLNLLAAAKRIRELLFPHADDVAYTGMTNLTPWYFPAKSIEAHGGSKMRQESDWWEAQWSSAGGLDVDEIRQKAPWLRYWIECTRDRSMRNRRRIWKAAEVVRDIASDSGFLGN